MRKDLFRLRLAIIALLIVSSVCLVVAQQRQSAAPSAEKESQRAVVTGAVNVPQHIELRRRIRLSEALIVAGGVTEKTKGFVQITHTDNSYATYRLRNLVRGDDKSNPYIQPGDIVSVLE